MLVLAESEFWPNLLSACKRNGVPVVVVNGRVSDRSLPRYVKLGVFWRPLLRSLALVLTQSEEDARRFKAIGVPSDRISLGGNLKFDIRAPQASPSTQLLKDHLHPGAKLLVCGSTLEGEEAMLLSAWEQIVGTVPEAVMLLAPRHPERFDKVAGMIAASGHPWVRRSEWIPAPAPIAAGSLILLDSIGELAGLYALATAAFLGGSLVAAGGHNPLEPAQFGVPIAMGASYENFRGAVELLMQRGAIRIVDAQRLAVELSGLLDESADTRAMGERGRAVFDEQAGATSRAAEAIVALLRKNREI
jgi:3-deoxy-D-manno-octulosonic-acid transferase